MPTRVFKSTAFAPIAPGRVRTSGYEYHAFPVDSPVPSAGPTPPTPGTVDARLLLVGPGGGGGKFYGGGGSGGDVLPILSIILDTQTSYQVTVGEKGLGATNGAAPRGDGSGVTSFGGLGFTPPAKGGSGGGGGGGPDLGFASGGADITGGGGSPIAAGVTNNGGVGTLTTGGASYYDGADSVAAGGGSSPIHNGGDAPHTGLTGGNGAEGVTDDITGADEVYGSGGGGGQKGNGGGGHGGTNAGFGGAPDGGSDATPNRGGGGGGGGGSLFLGNGGNGADGVVYVRYAGPAMFTGGTITTVGGDTLHEFLTTGSLDPL